MRRLFVKRKTHVPKICLRCWRYVLPLCNHSAPNALWLHKGRTYLLDGDGLCEVAGLIDVVSEDVGDVIREKLHRNH
jgi:hypothetical protein